MKYIELTKGKQAIVDDDNFEWLNKWKWTYLGGGTNNYAYRHDYSQGSNKPITVRMHRLIINAHDGLDVDHINRNGLDNRISNLREVNRTQNNYNTGIHKNNKTGVTGVCWCDRLGLWRAYIGGSKSRVELGYYKSFSDAIESRKNAEVMTCE